MITKPECENIILEQYRKDPSQFEDNPSLFMQKVWSENKGTCFSYFNNSTLTLKKFLEAPNETSQETTEQNNNTQTHNAAPAQTVQTTPSIPAVQKQWKIHWTLYIIKLIIFLTILALIIKKILKWCFRRGYAFLHHNRMIYMKVLVPRWDSKTDREQAKEIAKDMKEKIWRMSQVYTNLKKLWKLNIKDKIMYKVFRKPRITLMYHYVNWVLNFIIWCYPEYKTLIEWSIWAQYPDSSIEIVNEPNVFKRKHYKVMPLQSEKDDVYTLKLYKKLSDDPINNIIDAIWNISKYDTATVMLNIKPLWDDRNTQAKKKIDRLYKNLDIAPDSIWWKLFSWIKKFFKLMFSWEW